jgi:archaellum component FlaF (FlaF/FlaG flagellin family)
MRRSAARVSLIVAVVTALMSIQPLSAVADHAQPTLDPSQVDYTPIGYYGPVDEAGTPVGASATIPLPGPVPAVGPNPSGKWVAYDTNVWESLALPSRHPGDNCNTLSPAEQAERLCAEGDLDPDGDGPGGYSGPNGTSNVHGACPPSSDPAFTPWGECFNNQLEWLDYFEQSMKEMLGDFGVVVHRYPFISPGVGSRGLALDAAGGQAYNIAAVVPGTDHPEQTVLVSGHYDFTDSGPAAAWDSAEGHTEVMRMAYIMANYWRKTGTRPSATVKFVPWDSEESGTHGSIDYVANNIPPGEEDKVRGYFNVDPCAGAYPAFKNGNPAVRVPEVLQLGNPAGQHDPVAAARFEAFNAKAEIVVDQVFDYLDDTITIAPGVEQPIFVSDAEAAADGPGGLQSQRGEIVTAVGGLLLFTSDYRNFEAAGIPIFNLFPDYFGPHADNTPASSEGITILHTPNDNLTSINRLTSADGTGLLASEGWAKGMEMCSQIEAWYMLQPEMAGTQTATTAPVAYYEALPNEAEPLEAVEFDASGTYQYADTATRTLVDPATLTYAWNFGDGSSGTGKIASHAYDEPGRFITTLTVTGAGGATDAMTLPVVVVPPEGPVLDPISDADAADGNFTLTWTFGGPLAGFLHYSVEESADLTTVFFDDAEGAIDQNWVVGTPTNPKIQPWQRSDSGTDKWMGNKRHSGAASFWTGVTPADSNPPPTNAHSILTLKEPLSLPLSNSIELEYWSLFKNESDDRGRLQLAIDDGDPGTQDRFQTIDIVGGPDDTFVPGDDFDLTFRSVNLGGFAGKTVRLRWIYTAGGSAPALSQPAGWYVDDIRVQAGTFQQIGTSPTTTFDVMGKDNGTYGYRVKAVYTNGAVTAPSNTEIARVTEANRPDLVVSNITAANNKSVREGQKVTITATITNQGNDSAGPSKTEFLLDGTTVLGLVDTASIAAGQNRNVSVNWDTRDVKGEHQIKVTADRNNQVTERVETNNSATLIVTVQGNKVKNGSFEQASESGAGPASWSESDTSAGSTSWSDSGTDGSKAASVQGTGGNAAVAGSPTWTSDPVAVVSGEVLTLAFSIDSRGASSAATAGLAYLGPLGNVLDTVTLATAPLTTAGFKTLENTVTIPAGVTQVRVVLRAFAPTDMNTAGSVTFDDVGLYSG